MKLVDRAVILGGLLALGLIGGALMQGPSAAPAPSGAVAGSTPEVLREAVVGTVRTLNPLFATTEPERDIDALLFRGLTRLGPDGEVVPDLAESWRVADNGRTYTFTLGDARWHDGAPVTADDVVFTVLVLQHPGYDGPYGASWRGVAAERIGAQIVRFRLPNAAAGFPLVATQPILPAHLLSGAPVDKLAESDFSRAPIGNGPFKLGAFDEAGADLVAATARSSGPIANPLRPAASAIPDATTRPRLDGYRFRFYTSWDLAADAFRRGDVDAIGGVSAPLARSLTMSGVKPIRYPRSVFTSVVLNLRPQQATAFRDARVRRALLLALDRPRMVSTLLDGHGTVAETPISPASFAYDRAAAGRVPYDPKQAVRLLRSAGWKRTSDGWTQRGKRPSRLEFELSAVESAANPVAHAVAQQVAADWARLGIRANLKTYTTEQLAQQRLLPGRYFAAVVDVNLGLDPDLYPLLGSTQAVTGGTNLAGYQSRTLDVQLQAARAYADPRPRKQRFVALQRTLAKELPILPLFFGDYLFLVRDTVLGPTPHEIARPSDRYWDVLAWRLADEP
jgi:peptide/nickel transport system substrate-binding protein